jgi:hypothetical protein
LVVETVQAEARRKRGRRERVRMVNGCARRDRAVVLRAFRTLFSSVFHVTE